MDTHGHDRRDSRVPSFAAATAAAPYDPDATFEVAVTELEFRRNAAGRQLMARVYQPNGSGPFPTRLDLHGGAWNATRCGRRSAIRPRAFRTPSGCSVTR